MAERVAVVVMCEKEIRELAELTECERTTAKARVHAARAAAAVHRGCCVWATTSPLLWDVPDAQVSEASRTTRHGRSGEMQTHASQRNVTCTAAADAAVAAAELESNVQRREMASA
jgi:hypothetical protein